MTEIHLYGIPNCDTVRKARKWLDGRGVGYVFHDFRKEGVDAEKLRGWAATVGWELLLNRRGTTWRKLPDDAKADVDEARAIELMAEHPSMIKRPVVEHPGGVLVGFDEAAWEAALA
ncbi:arsenate reductase [Novosphingobium marinum]|uniref:Spx/MgsR family transcriptional regulator n=1 Tax=Novosphingobium marinum TaxID=1514948 RepID=A0A7Z0BVC6_9SPHN|nr:ArsC family reductase [Novosphingobium marinum]NYH95092.1 Spx/MgsR family transcriptional regulator [Novosphingobium marinum]GGC24219.1 arsenate reductase [Novosphingobium marinum]